MNKLVEKQEGAKSDVDIAAMLVASTKEPPVDDPQDEEAPEEVLEEEQSPSGGDDQDELPPEAEASEDDDEAGDEHDDEIEYLDLDDATLIDVVVDGEEREVSIGELKKAFSGEGAIEKRLQEATELRKTAHAERTSALEKLHADELAIRQVFDGLDESLFKEVIPAPTAKLKAENPEQYIRHLDAYNQDQARIAAAKKYFDEKKVALEKQRSQRLEEYGKVAAQVIAQEIPELVDPKTGQHYFKRMADTAMAYGYSQAEIANALDPRMFLLVRDAMKYRNLMDKTKERDPKDLEGQKRKKVRRLKSGNTSAKTRARQNDKTRQAAVERAKKTGSVKDIAATLLT